MSINGRMPLSATDLLGLAEQRKVAMVDLAEAGYSGIVFVCDLTAVQVQQIVAYKPGSKIEIRKDQTKLVDLSAMADTAGPKILEKCLVTDHDGGKTLMRAFEALGEPEEGDESIPFITLPAAELVYMFDLWAAELKRPHLAREKLEQFSNAFSTLVVKVVKEISGMAGEVVEEKKDD